MSDNEMEDWTGEVGDRWLANIDGFEGMLSLLHARLANSIDAQPGESILDIGCGCGPLALRLAQQVGAQGRVCGVDIAPQLIDLARKRASDARLDNVTFEVADAGSTAVSGAPFDRLVSSFGVMFFEESEAAFRNILALGKSGAKLDFAAWAAPDRNPWMGMVMGVIGQHAALPEPDPTAPGPFRFANEAATTAMLEAAGFKDVAVQAIEQDQPLGGPWRTVEQAVDFVMAALDMDALLREQDVDRAPVMADLTEALGPYASEQGVMLPGCALFYSGRM